MVEAARQYGDVVCLDPQAHQIYLLSHPDHIKHVLQDNYRNYRRDADTFKLMVGEGLIVSEGDFWLRQRRLMQPAFHRQQIASLLPTMTGVTAAMLERWQTAAESGQPLDIVAEMMRLTMSIIVKTMFSTDVDDEIETAARAMTIGQEYIYQQGWSYDEAGWSMASFESAARTISRPTIY
jgi:cytochrome P450